MSDLDKLPPAERNLERLLSWIGRLDVKFSILLGIETAMLGFLASVTPSVKCIDLLHLILTIITFMLILISFSFIFFGMFPRLKGPDKSLIYFGSISKISFDEYKTLFSDSSKQSYLDDLLEQCHINSRIIDTKFSKLKTSYILLLLSLSPWLYLVYTYR
jgi:hypothetical protein